jgi:hypothetical protein
MVRPVIIKYPDGMIDLERVEYWTCTIGPIERKKIGWGADFPLRQAVKEEFENTFDTIEYEISSGFGTTDELKDIYSRISNLNITDPSGETLNKIKALLDKNTTLKG